MHGNEEGLGFIDGMPTALPPELLDLIARTWGFRTLRPLQERAMAAVVAQRDSLVVMPTGGGKSLCFQAPAVYGDGLTVVVSPLIALMKDQVDALVRNGVNAVRLDSSQTANERQRAELAVQSGMVSLVYASPERLAMPSFPEFLERAGGVRAVAIDEAHCISQWGHDFRQEYRQLGRLREIFPKASVHGYTATATPRVREDVARQLKLRDPDIMVGNFDRPNLTYRVLPKLDVVRQVRDVLDKHPKRTGIVYCLRRLDVDSLAASLVAAGYDARGYHAGMNPEERRKAQDEFATAESPVIVATIAFGMGIDRPDVRLVVHAAIPKSVEHYQQEIGRAGRDGLPSECVLLFSGSDVITMRNIITKSAQENGADPAYLPTAIGHLNDMDRYARGSVCRHQALVRYFGQDYETPNCKACDLCLGDTTDVPEATVIAQKILSCVARVKESYGVNHVIGVLRGEAGESITRQGHDQLSTYGLLKEVPKATLRDWVYQLLGQQVLMQSEGEYPLLKLNADSWAVMKGQKPVRLVQLVLAKKDRRKPDEPRRPAPPVEDLSDAETELFEALRTVRRELAESERVPAYVIFADVVLLALARYRPQTPVELQWIPGIGEKKSAAYGSRFLEVIAASGLAPSLDDVRPATAYVPPKTKPNPSAKKVHAATLFARGTSIPDVMSRIGVAQSTATEYLLHYIETEKPKDVSAWVSDEIYREVLVAAQAISSVFLRPVFDALEQKVPYETIKIVLAHRRVTTE